MSNDVIKLNIGQAEDILRGNVLKDLSKKPLPIKVSYLLTVLIEKLEDELKVYFSKKDEVLKEYSEKEIDGRTKVDEYGAIVFTDENRDIVISKLTELTSLELEINLKKVDLNLDDCPDLSIEEVLFIKQFVNYVEI